MHNAPGSSLEELHKSSIALINNSIEESHFRDAVVTQLVKKFSAFYGTRSLLINSQEPASDPYPELHEPNSLPHTLFPF
jgi:hypothetical protein